MDTATTTTIATAVIAGLAILIIVWKLTSSSNKKKEEPAAATTTTTSKKSKKKKKTNNKSRSIPIVVEEKKQPEPEPTTSSKQKKKKKKGSNNGKEVAPVVETKKEEPVVAEPTPPAPVVEPTPPEPEPTTKSKKKRKKKSKNNNNNNTNGTSNKSTPPPAAEVTPAPVPVEDSDDDDDDDALLTFAKTLSSGNSKKKTATTNGKDSNNNDGGGWNTIPNKKKSSRAAAAALLAAENGDGGAVSLNITSKDIPVLLGPKGSTIQELQASTGAKLDILGKNLASPVVKITGTDEQVSAAVAQVQDLIAVERAKVAHSVTLSGSEIQGSDGVKAIVGRAGTTIQNIQSVSGCQLNATIDTGTVVITGPSAEAVQTAERMCKNAVFGESNTTINFVSRPLLLAVCGRNFAMLRQLQEESGGARLDVEKGSTLMKISGDTAPVAKAKELVRQRMQLCQGTTILFDASNTGAIFGQGGTNLRRIQDSTGAVIDIVDHAPGEQSECRIVGEPDAVKAAEIMIHKSLSGEVELKPGEVREVMDLGVGAAAVIGRGGSKIAELESTYKVKLNVTSGTGECSIVGKKDAVTKAKSAIDEIVEPLKQKALEEERIRKQAEELTASGDDTWGGVVDDDADGW